MNLKMFNPVLVAALLLGMCACTTDQVTTTLEAAVDLAIATVPIVETTAGVSPAVQAVVNSYLNDANTCLTDAANVLGTAGLSPANAAAQIIGQCGAAVTSAPSFPQGTPTAIIQAVSAVASAVAKFVSQITATSATLQEYRPALAFGFAGNAKTAKVDQKRLAKIKVKIATLHQKLGK